MKNMYQSEPVELGFKISKLGIAYHLIALHCGSAIFNMAVKATEIGRSLTKHLLTVTLVCLYLYH